MDRGDEEPRRATPPASPDGKDAEVLIGNGLSRIAGLKVFESRLCPDPAAPVPRTSAPLPTPRGTDDVRHRPGGQGTGTDPARRAAATTDLLEGAAEEVDQRQPEDQGEHPPLPQKPAPQQGRQVHHPGAQAGRGGRGEKLERPGDPVAWLLHDRRPHPWRRAGLRGLASSRQPARVAPRDPAPRPASACASPAKPFGRPFAIGRGGLAESYWLNLDKRGGSYCARGWPGRTLVLAPRPLDLCSNPARGRKHSEVTCCSSRHSDWLS